MLKDLFFKLIWFTLALCYGQTITLTQAEESSTQDILHRFEILNALNLSGRILFTVTIEKRDRIFILDLDAKRIRKLVDTPANNFYPQWAPNGERFTFTSDRDGNKEIYIADWDGENQRRLTKNSFGDDNATWAPNGKQIVYYAEEPNDTTNLYTINPERPSPERLTSFTGRNTTPRWSPDNQSIAYSTNRFWPGWDICVWSIYNKREACPLAGGQTYCRPAYSPNGQLMAYSYGVFDEIDIAILNLDTNEQLQISALPGREYDTVFSPDGSHLIFTAEAGKKELFNLYATGSRATGNQAKAPSILLKAPYSIRYLSWSGVKTIDLEAKRLRDLQE